MKLKLNYNQIVNSFKHVFHIIFLFTSYSSEWVISINFIVSWYPVCFFRTLHIMWWFEKHLNHIIIFTTLIYNINFLKPDPIKSLTWTWNFHHTTSLLFLENTISFFKDEFFRCFSMLMLIGHFIPYLARILKLPC